MKPLLAAALALIAGPLLAQTSTTTTSTSTTTTTPSASAPPAGRTPDLGNYAAALQQATSTLTPAEKTELTTAREKAMTDPSLQAEEMDLMQKIMAMQSGDSTVDRQALGQEMRAHGDKVRTAMIKADPGVEPIIAKVEAQVAKLKADAQAAQH